MSRQREAAKLDACSRSQPTRSFDPGIGCHNARSLSTTATHSRRGAARPGTAGVSFDSSKATFQLLVKRTFRGAQGADTHHNQHASKKNAWERKPARDKTHINDFEDTLARLLPQTHSQGRRSRIVKKEKERTNTFSYRASGLTSATRAATPTMVCTL